MVWNLIISGIECISIFRHTEEDSSRNTILYSPIRMLLLPFSIWKQSFSFHSFPTNINFLLVRPSSLERRNMMLYLFWYNEASIFYETLNLAKMMLMKGNKSHKFFCHFFLLSLLSHHPTKANKILLYFCFSLRALAAVKAEFMCLCAWDEFSSVHKWKDLSSRDIHKEHK